MKMRDILKYGIILMVVASISAGLLAFVYNATEEKAKKAAEKETRMALLEVLPQAKVFEPVIKTQSGDVWYYAGYESKDKKNIAGYACIAEGKGYSSTISTMVGITPDGTITGVKVISQKETPGLGAKIEEVDSGRSFRDIFKRGQVKKKGIKKKPWFQSQFTGKKPEDLYAGKMDTITGATITSKAVIDSVRKKIKALLKEQSSTVKKK